MHSSSLHWNFLFPHWGHRIQLPPWLSGILSSEARDEAEASFAFEIEQAPKIELHVHLEASVRAEFYEKLNARQNKFPLENVPSARAPFASLKDFIWAWVDNTRLIDSESVFEELAFSSVQARAAHNIVYSEMHVSPVDFSLLRVRFPQIGAPYNLESVLRGYLRGIRRGEEKFPHVAVRLIFDALWLTNDEERAKIFDVLERVCASSDNLDSHGEPILVGVGLGGEESDRALETKPFLEACRALGLRVDIHSGENGTSERHRRALEILQPDRVGHGIAGASEDWFYEKHIAACPLSNVLTGCFTGPLSLHPVGRMLEKGHVFSINSDDPLLFSTTLTLEFVALRSAFGLGLDFFKQAQKNAAQAVFAPQVLERVMGQTA